MIAWTLRRPSHRLTRLPVVTLMPHSRCNCRCVMCDIWKANKTGTSLPESAVAQLVEDLKAFGVEEILLSGGEALMHPDLWALCERLSALSAQITLLSSGLLLARYAPEIVRWCDGVIVSLDGPEPVHNAIRGISEAYAALAEGVAALRQAAPGFRVTARSVVQKDNFRVLTETVAAARAIGLDQISFLPADLTSTAFNRPSPWERERSGAVGLTAEESAELVQVIETLVERHRADFRTRFIAESPAKMRKIAAHFRAAHGIVPPPKRACNAPWVSTVVEADGTVRPCFFHAPLGKLGEARFEAIVNGPQALAFRQGLDVRRDPICRNCVCTLKR